MLSTGVGHIIILTLCFLIVLAGFVGIAFPIVPSIPLIWFGILLYGLATDFTLISPSFLLIISVLGLAVVLLDFAAYLWGGKQFRASVWGVFGAVLGGLLGSFFGLMFALVIGPFFGAVISQLIVGRDRVFAVETKHYIVIGYMGGMIVKFSAGIAMIGLFLWQLFRAT